MYDPNLKYSGESYYKMVELEQMKQIAPLEHATTPFVTTNNVGQPLRNIEISTN